MSTSSSRQASKENHRNPANNNKDNATRPVLSTPRKQSTTNLQVFGNQTPSFQSHKTPSMCPPTTKRSNVSSRQSLNPSTFAVFHNNNLTPRPSSKNVFKKSVMPALKTASTAASTLRPPIMNTSSNYSGMVDVEQAQKTLELELSFAQKNAGNLSDQLKQIHTKKEELGGKLRQLNKQLETHKKKGEGGLESQAEFSAEFDSCYEAEQALKLKQQQWNENADAISSLEKKIASLQEYLVTLQAEQTELKMQIDHDTQRFAEKRAKWKVVQEDAQSKIKHSRLFCGLVKQRDELTIELQELENQFDVLQEDWKASDFKVKKIRNQLELYSRDTSLKGPDIYEHDSALGGWNSATFEETLASTNLEHTESFDEHPCGDHDADDDIDNESLASITTTKANKTAFCIDDLSFVKDDMVLQEQKKKKQEETLASDKAASVDDQLAMKKPDLVEQLGQALINGSDLDFLRASPATKDGDESVETWDMSGSPLRFNTTTTAQTTTNSTNRPPASSSHPDNAMAHHSGRDAGMFGGQMGGANSASRSHSTHGATVHGMTDGSESLADVSMGIGIVPQADELYNQSLLKNLNNKPMPPLEMSQKQSHEMASQATTLHAQSFNDNTSVGTHSISSQTTTSTKGSVSTAIIVGSRSNGNSSTDLLYQDDNASVGANSVTSHTTISTQGSVSTTGTTRSAKSKGKSFQELVEECVADISLTELFDATGPFTIGQQQWNGDTSLKDLFIGGGQQIVDAFFGENTIAVCARALNLHAAVKIRDCQRPLLSAKMEVAGPMIENTEFLENMARKDISINPSGRHKGFRRYNSRLKPNATHKYRVYVAKVFDLDVEYEATYSTTSGRSDDDAN